MTSKERCLQVFPELTVHHWVLNIPYLRCMKPKQPRYKKGKIRGVRIDYINTHHPGFGWIGVNGDTEQECFKGIIKRNQHLFNNRSTE